MVFFDIGTTSLEVADALNASKRINAFTNSLRVAIALGEKCASVIVPGGEIETDYVINSAGQSRLLQIV